MSKSKIDATSRTADKSKQPSHNPPSFFNPTASSQAKKRTRIETAPPAQETRLTTTELLLAGILEELRTRNQIELMKLKMVDEREQAETEAAETIAAEDKEHFESEIRSRMYA